MDSHEVRVPFEYDTAVAEFFATLDGDEVTASSLRLTLTALFRQTLQTSSDHLHKVAEGLSNRFAYDMDTGDGDEAIEPDAEGDYDLNSDHVIDKKAGLLAAVTGFLVASEYSRLTDSQRFAFFGRALDQARELGEVGEAALEEALLVHIAHDAELAGADNDRAARLTRGSFVLQLAMDRNLIEPESRRLFSRALRRRVDKW